MAHGAFPTCLLYAFSRPWRVLCVCALNSDWLSNYFCFGGIVYDTQY